MQVLLVLAGNLAQAQGFDAQRYVPPAGAAGGLLIERAQVPRHLGGSVGLFVNYADDSVVLRDPDSGEILSRPLDALFGMDLLGSFALFDRLELAIDIPVMVLYAGDTLRLGPTPLVAAPGLGDVRLVPKVVLLETGSQNGFQLGAALPITLPTGDAEALRGAGELSLEPRVLLGLWTDVVDVHGSAGLRVRPGLDPLDPIGNELTFGAGLAVAAIPGERGLDLLLEGTGAADLTRKGPALTDLPFELLGGLEWRPARDWALTAGAGPGLTDGLGTPDFRVVVGLRYTPEPDGDGSDAGEPDRDGDRIADSDDRCPDVPEDHDGFEDRDGCPEPDNDGDEILDDDDECPQSPEEAGGDGDGCPERGEARRGSDRIEVDGKILFALESADLDPRSDRLLNELARVIESNPDIERVIIQGHTDSTGDETYNDELSERRAASVRAALIERGIDGDRLVTRGFGERRPLAPNDTPAGRASNRRVEFMLKE